MGQEIKHKKPFEARFFNISEYIQFPICSFQEALLTRANALKPQ